MSRRDQRLETLTVALWDYEAVLDFCPIYSLQRVHNKATRAVISDRVILTDDYTKEDATTTILLLKKMGAMSDPRAMSVTSAGKTELLALYYEINNILDPI